MADSDKNILITPNRGSTSDPNIEFTGGDNNTISLTVLDDGTLSFSGGAGQLFSIVDSSTGTLFSVNDVSGIPSIEVDDTGEIRLAEFAGNVLVGTNVDDDTNKLQVEGGIKSTSIETGAITGTSFSGNAATASRWANSRTFTIQVDGQTADTELVTGSGNVTFNIPRDRMSKFSNVLNSANTNGSSSWRSVSSAYTLDSGYSGHWIDGGGNAITLYLLDRNAYGLFVDQIRVDYVFVRNVSAITFQNQGILDAGLDPNIELPTGSTQVAGFVVMTLGMNTPGQNDQENYVSFMGLFDV